MWYFLFRFIFRGIPGIKVTMNSCLEKLWKSLLSIFLISFQYPSGVKPRHFTMDGFIILFDIINTILYIIYSSMYYSKVSVQISGGLNNFVQDGARMQKFQITLYCRVFVSIDLKILLLEWLFCKKLTIVAKIYNFSIYSFLWGFKKKLYFYV